MGGQPADPFDRARARVLHPGRSWDSMGVWDGWALISCWAATFRRPDSVALLLECGPFSCAPSQPCFGPLFLALLQPYWPDDSADMVSLSRRASSAAAGLAGVRMVADQDSPGHQTGDRHGRDSAEAPRQWGALALADFQTSQTGPAKPNPYSASWMRFHHTARQAAAVPSNSSRISRCVAFADVVVGPPRAFFGAPPAIAAIRTFLQ
ncbi:hypothetical protein K458DRAFT_398963 [Lentithecium fluviatile CBS 122367]|uniref:Uncharacterized protein n=1 Tax=Lentithecium fluviatile CBS 122367 TaxID=1168545 RepID=A0A6G1JKS1_9PLEO|nr:hypothetical protein K458DRAFT_398963 [Lentithecium fluviatile CBS 122367]